MMIAGREISAKESPYIIAELGAAHNGLLDRALTLMEHAKQAGADAFKIQVYSADTITFDGAGDEFTIPDGPWRGRQLWELYDKAAMPREWYGALFERSEHLKLPIIASVFSREDLAWMGRYSCAAYKIASFELTDVDLIEAVAATGKPVIMSTGMAVPEDVYAAWDALVRGGGAATDVAFLHCISAYPAPPEEMDLRRMQKLPGQVGLSDHSLGIEAAVAATALGATIIEKHITLSRGGDGEDDHFATEPHEFGDMVDAVRRAHEMLQRRPGPEVEAAWVESPHFGLRRSLYVVRDIQPGERFTRDNVRSIRPGKGLEVKHLPVVLDRTCKVAVKAGTAMSFDFVEGVWP